MAITNFSQMFQTIMAASIGSKLANNQKTQSDLIDPHSELSERLKKDAEFDKNEKQSNLLENYVDLLNTKEMDDGELEDLGTSFMDLDYDIANIYYKELEKKINKAKFKNTTDALNNALKQYGLPSTKAMMSRRTRQAVKKANNETIENNVNHFEGGTDNGKK